MTLTLKSVIFSMASMEFTILAMLPLLFGCADLHPFVGYTHLDETPLSRDEQAFDFVCGGVKYRAAIELSAAACRDIRAGAVFRFDAEYVWRKK